MTYRFDVKAHVYSEEENQLILDTVIRLNEENAKLREYVRTLTKATVYGPCEWCQHDSDGTCGTETEPMRDGCRLYEEMRELGIEVEYDKD